jgi:hypothetical protein
MSPSEEADLHTRASAVAEALAREPDEDARTVASYYRSCRRAADRAAEQLLLYARARTPRP